MKVRCIDTGRNELIKKGYEYQVVKETNFLYYIIVENGQERGYHKERFEIVKENDNMKELTFKEVIANIKADEVWENNKIKITTNSNLDGDFRITLKEEKEGELYLFNREKFKLQRQKVTFQEAFKAYEEGKEIESCVNNSKYLKGDKEEYYKNIDDLNWRVWFAGGGFNFDEIRGEWYINE